MKNMLFIFSLLILLSACGDSDMLKPYGKEDTTAPQPIENLEWKIFPGGAIFTYSLSDEPDLAFVKLTYSVDGVEKEMTASHFKKELVLEGLPSKEEYEVFISVIDKAGNESEKVMVTITPDESPVKVMRESLKMTEDFGGFIIDYENPSESELTIYVYKKDKETEQMKFYDARVFSQKKGSFQVVGLPNETNNFEVFIRDRFNNTSEILSFEARPWREEYLDKKNFKYIGAPRVYDKDDWYAWMGIPENLWDDIVGEWNFAQTAGNGEFPHYFCIDLGVTSPIGRIKFQQRLGSSNIFNLSCIKHFNVYGVAELPIVNNDNPLEGWIKLNDKVFEVIRPSGAVPGDRPTTEDFEAAEKGIIFTIDTPFPRPEIRYIRFEFLDNFVGSNMAILSELSFWAQWK